MSCGCKAKKGDELSVNNENKPKVKIIVNVIHYSMKLIGFLVALSLLPILMLVIAYYMFNLIVMTKEIDIKPLFVSASKFMKKVAKDNNSDDEDDDDEEDDTEWENINPDEFELIGVDDITNKEGK
jgi:hypothetical protein